MELNMNAGTPLRTPDARFEGLPAWPYRPHYSEYRGLRIARVDEGPRDAAVTALCLHGNPSWSYLYRHMIPVFAGAGLRVVAPDLIGFGRSDKPTLEADHTWDLHRGMLLDLVDRLALGNVLLVVQDWGGLLGLTLPLDRPRVFTRLLLMNTAIGTGVVTDGFRQWRAYSNSQPDLAVGKLMQRGTPDMTPEEAAAYDAPFPDASFKAALRAFPNLVPDGEDAPGAALSRRALQYWRETWTGDSLMAIGMQDPVLGAPAMRPLQRIIRGCPPPLELERAGHFVQEHGGPIARAALRHFRLDHTPLVS
jgi:pimeloyl-ACP methyl ester carboxylesterase